MTGNPAALASALMKVSEGLVAIPQKDLRAAAVGDAFHLLPARDAQQFMLPADASAARSPHRPARAPRTRVAAGITYSRACCRRASPS